MSTPASVDPRPTRRDRLRQETLTEIKTLAREQLRDSGAGALSLRAIAREMGMSSSALYRYFASLEDLVGALCADAYASVADALEEARDAEPADDPARQWWAVGHAYRRWALANRAEFALIFGTPIPGYQAPPEVTGPAAGRFGAILATVYAAAVGAAAADPDRTRVPGTISAGDGVTQLLGDAAADYPPRSVGILLNAWASWQGYLMAEVFGSLGRLVGDSDELYAAHACTVMAGAGFQHEAIETVSRAQPGSRESRAQGRSSR